MKRKNKLNNRGQAAIEMALSLPFIIWLFFYTLNAFYSIHTSHVSQRYAAMNLYQRLNNRAKFVMDDQTGDLHNNTFMAVRYNTPGGDAPKRKILFGPMDVKSVVGICREPGC